MSKAVVFDNDGTLANSRELILAAYEHVARTHGLPVMTEAEITRHWDKDVRGVFEALYPGQDVDRLLATNGAFINERYTRAAMYEGVADLLAELHRAGWKLAIVTNGDGGRLQQLLDFHDIRKYFATIVHNERVQKQKPDPEGILLALGEIDVDPKDAVMIGDMDYDILAGKNAGVQTIGVTHGFGTRKDLKAAGADVVLDSIIEVRNYLLGESSDRS